MYHRCLWKNKSFPSRKNTCSPLIQKTRPKLELKASVNASPLRRKHNKELPLRIDQTVHWSDSASVLEKSFINNWSHLQSSAVGVFSKEVQDLQQRRNVNPKSPKFNFSLFLYAENTLRSMSRLQNAPVSKKNKDTLELNI